MLSAIIFAAGTSQRMGFDKVFALLGNKPVVAHAIHAFEHSDSVTDIILVGRSDRLEELSELVRVQGFAKVHKVISGGERRQDSVRAGLGTLANHAKFVAVHDAARPLITPQQIERVFEIARAQHAAVLGEPVTDTLKRVTEDSFVCASMDPVRCNALQTPQIFSRELLQRAY